MSLSSLGILPFSLHIEDTDYQHQAEHAIAIIPHFISDAIEATMKN